MTGYSIKNIKDVEDQAPKAGLSPSLEARFARDDLETEQLGVSFQRLAPGFRQPFGHRHKEQEEIYTVVGGSGRVKIDDEIHDVEELDLVRIGPGTARCFEAGDEGLELLVVGPRLKDPDEIEMLQGWWSD
jgi:uncharacterized cupin superfamily protein